jgi:hypothetical protein
MAYILAGFRYVHPEVGINDALTPVGLEAVKHAETECTTTLQKELEDVPIGNLFTRSLGSLPGFSEAIADYMAMPEGGFDRPLFMGNGLLDTDVPYAFPAPYAESLTLRGEPITFRTYPGDHNQTLIDSQRDTIPFVRKLFAGPAN